MVNAWVFQTHPRDFDIREWLQTILAGQSEPEKEWSVQRFASLMQAGDRVFFWQSGTQGGLLASGELLSGAYLSDIHPPEKQRCVGVQIQAQFMPPLQRADLQLHPLLQKLSFTKRPQGQVFQVNQEALNCLEHLLKQRRQPLPVYQHSRSLPRIHQALSRQGLQVSASFLRRYHLALQTASMVILAGRSGVGKSWLSQAYAQATGAKYLLVPVAPNWVGPEDFLGYYNAISDRLQSSAATEFIQEAYHHWRRSQHQQIPAQAYYLTLDEINLARIEYYLAPLLSVLELRRRGEPAGLQLADGSPLWLPPNLYVVGTLNRDPYAAVISDKVYDRCHVLEMEFEIKSLSLIVAGDAGQFLDQIQEPLLTLCPLGYRSLEDIAQYLRLALELETPWQTALDEALVQKCFSRLESQPVQVDAADQLLSILGETFPLSQARLQSWLNATHHAYLA